MGSHSRENTGPSQWAVNIILNEGLRSVTTILLLLVLLDWLLLVMAVRLDS
jgi:hypothetical protein